MNVNDGFALKYDETKIIIISVSRFKMDIISSIFCCSLCAFVTHTKNTQIETDASH